VNPFDILSGSRLERDHNAVARLCRSSVKGKNDTERWAAAGSVHDACASGGHLIETLSSEGSANFVVELDGATQIVCSDEDEVDHGTRSCGARTRDKLRHLCMAQLVSVETVQQTTSDIKIPAVSAATVSLISAVMVSSMGMIFM
jgi:hypothetical protein